MKALLLSHNAWLKNAALPLQVIGVLSAVVFVLNFSLEILLFQGLQQEHQVLLLALLITLAAWAIVECALLQRQQKQLPVKKLYIALMAQFVVEVLRLALVFFGVASGIDRVYGVSVFHVGPLIVLLPVYSLVFLFIAKALVASYITEIKSVSEILQASNEELKRMTAIQVEQSRFKVRKQLLQDMHDGFGSQLASVRILAEQGRINAEQLPKYLQEITADLHMIVDTLSQDDITLNSALMDMRYRWHRRFNNGTPQLHWQIELDATPTLDTRFILHILRIMQEALNNAIRHAKPQNVWLIAEYDQTRQRLLVSVRDDGIGMPSDIRHGRGLSNMHQRAREMSAHLERISHEPGTEIRLTLDLAKED